MYLTNICLLSLFFFSFFILEAVANLLIMGFLTKAVHNYVLEAVVRLFIMAFEVLTQAVHNCVRFNSCSEGNIRQELRHFTSYLIEAYSLSLVEGSVVIVLGCHTLESQFQECTIYKKKKKGKK